MGSARKLAAKKIVWSLATALALGAAGAAGCSNDKPTELVPGALSQVQVPRDLDGIELEVKANGVVTFCSSASVYDGTVELPRTLGVVSGQSVEAIVTVTIRGFSQSATNPNFGQCNDIPVGDPQGPQVLRRSIQTFVGQHTLFLPMALSYSCFNTNCESGTGSTSTASAATSTCAASRCVDLAGTDPKVAASKLVDFTPSLIDGTDVCFSPKVCFSDELPAVAVLSSSGDGGGDAASSAGDAGASECTYTFPVPPLGSGLNVKVFFQDFTWTMDSSTGVSTPVPSNAGEVEILNDDAEEGFTVSATNPRQFTLAPGLCDLVNAGATPPPPPPSGALTYHTISGVHAASACTPKAALLPICANERNPPAVLPDGGKTPNLPDGGTTTNGVCNVGVPLVPALSAMYMVMDDSAAMHAAFGMQGYATAMGLSLTYPVFNRTNAGFKILSHLDIECTSPTTSFTMPDLDFKLAAAAQSGIAAKLQDWTAPGDTPLAPLHLDLQAAMRPDAGAYAEVLDFLTTFQEPPDIAAAMFFVNRVPDPTPLTGNDCPLAVTPPATASQVALQALEAEAEAAYTGATSLRTFFVVLDDDAHDGPTVTVPFYTQMQTDLPQAVTTIDATSMTPSVVLGKFTQVVTQLGTCLYELPAGVTDTSQAAVSYNVPGTPVTVPVPVDPTCSADNQNSANGWNVDSNARLRICGDACTNLRQTILAVSATALINGQPVPDVPVNAAVLCSASDTGGTMIPPDAGGTIDAGAAIDASSTAVDAGASADATVGAPDDAASE